MKLAEGVFFKHLGAGKWEAWIESYYGLDWVITCEAKGMMTEHELMIDVIETRPGYREMKHAQHMLEAFRAAIPLTVVPIGILPEAQGFWDKMKERGLVKYE
ncbi:MAG: hypothetical protein ACREGB_00165 [Candidatus Saccharimonadales bacterium]